MLPCSNTVVWSIWVELAICNPAPSGRCWLLFNVVHHFRVLVTFTQFIQIIQKNLLILMMRLKVRASEMSRVIPQCSGRTQNVQCLCVSVCVCASVLVNAAQKEPLLRVQIQLNTGAPSGTKTQGRDLIWQIGGGRPVCVYVCVCVCVCVRVIWISALLSYKICREGKQVITELSVSVNVRYLKYPKWIFTFRYLQ